MKKLQLPTERPSTVAAHDAPVGESSVPQFAHGGRLMRSAALVLALGLAACSSRDKTSSIEQSAPAVQKVNWGMEPSEGARDCPAYASHQATFLAASNNQWSRAAELTSSVFGQRSEVGACGGSIMLPRNNFIDDYIVGKIEADGIPHSDVCTDEEFIRRAYLDLTGRVPPANAVLDFLANPSATKRAELVDALLDTEEYVDRWTMRFGDMLENALNSPANPLLFDGRTIYYDKIKDFVQNNLPYNQFVTELLTAEGDSFVTPEVNFFGRSWENMANRCDVIDNTVIQAGQRFLGIPILCVSCHNGAGHLDRTNLYLVSKTRRDFWGVGAFLSQANYTRPNAGLGVKYIFEFSTYAAEAGYRNNSPGCSGGVRPARTPATQVTMANYFFTGEQPEDGQNRRSELARILTSDRQFARATVNYLWKELLGMGIVDPPDAFDLARMDPDNPPPAPWTVQPTHPDLLERLATEFIARNYNIKDMLRLIANSTAYQLSANFPGTFEADYAFYFARHFAKRMTAEQLLDSVYLATGLNDTLTIRDTPATHNMGTVQWAMKMPDPTEPTQANIRDLLNTFLRGTRDDRVREPEGSMLQAMALLNNNLIVNKIRSTTAGSLVRTLLNEPGLTDGDLVDRLFIATLSRYPTAEERTKALDMLSQNRSLGAENLHLALFNKLDFLFY